MLYCHCVFAKVKLTAREIIILIAVAKSANLAKILEVQVQRSKRCFLAEENRPYRLLLSPHQISLSQSVLPFVITC